MIVKLLRVMFRGCRSSLPWCSNHYPGIEWFSPAKDVDKAAAEKIREDLEPRAEGKGFLAAKPRNRLRFPSGVLENGEKGRIGPKNFRFSIRHFQAETQTGWVSPERFPLSSERVSEETHPGMKCWVSFFWSGVSEVK